jgi:phage major head subunit gpT-like protein
MATTGIRRLTERGVLGNMLYAGLLKQWFSALFFRVDSNQPDGETNVWLGGVPQMAERTGDPKFAKLRGSEFFIRNIPWESGILVSKEDWDYQKTSQVERKIGEQARVATAHPGVLAQTLIGSAETSAGADGQYYYDTDHSQGDSGTQSNDLTFTSATPTAPTVDEMVKAILAAVCAMWGFKDDQGNEMNLGASKFMIAAGPSMYPVVLEAVRNKLLSNGGSNIVADGRDFALVPQILPRRTGNKVYTFRADEGAAPFILQVLQDNEPVVLGRDSEYCKLNGNLLFKLDGNYNVGYGMWQHACLTTFAAA